ncbi:MAG: MFS transporter [Telluria sp.]
MGTLPQPASRVAVFCCVFLPFALGHFMSTLLRNVNAVLAPQFIAALGLSPGQLGLLSSAFFCAFALAQLPVGLALDRYGPRRVQAALLLLAAAGALLFAAARSYPGLVAARFLIGVGLGGSFMSGVKALVACVPVARMPTMNGYLIAAGGIGAAAATMPVRALSLQMGWRGVFGWLALAVLAVAALVWTLAPRAAPASARSRFDFASVLACCRHPVFRRTVSLVLVPHAVFFGLQGMWMGRWLADAGGYSESAVAYLLYLSMAAVVFGAIAVGMVTEWAARHGLRPLDVGAAGITAFLLVQGAILFARPPWMQNLPLMFTLFGSITGIEYAIVAQGLPRELTGRASTCLNLLIFIAAFLVQTVFGLVVGCWRPDAAGHYPAAAYRAAYGLMLLAQLPGLVQWLFRPHHEEHHEIAALRPAGEGKTGPARR